MLDDDELAQALRDTFRAHEHLADDAPTMPSAPVARSLRRPVLVAAAGVVAAALVSVPIVLSGDDDASTPTAVDPAPTSTAPTTGPTSTAVPGVGDARNRAAAVRLGRTTLVALTEYLEGLDVPARRVRAGDVPLLRVPIGSTGPGDHTLRRSRYFLIPGGSASDVVDAIDSAPPSGFKSLGVGGSSSRGGPWKPYVDLLPVGGAPDAPASASVYVELAPVGEQVGLRVDVSTVWRPVVPQEARAGADVTAIRVRSGDETYDVTDPRKVSSLVRAFDRMPGWPDNFHSCPAFIDDLTVRFEGGSGVLVATWSQCYRMWDVRRDGRHVTYLEDVFSPTFADLVRQVD